MFFSADKTQVNRFHFCPQRTLAYTHFLYRNHQVNNYKFLLFVWCFYVISSSTRDSEQNVMYTMVGYMRLRGKGRKRARTHDADISSTPLVFSVSTQCVQLHVFECRGYICHQQGWQRMGGCVLRWLVRLHVSSLNVDDYKAKMQTLDSFIHTFEFELKITITESATCIYSIYDIEIFI